LTGLWFEQFTEGLTMDSTGRTITEADIVHFAGISGDFNPMHIDADYAKSTQFGQRVAHGALIFSVATGIAFQMGFLLGTVMAFTGFEMKLRAPVYIGETIKVGVTVAKTRAMAAAGGGLVTFDIKVTKQDGTVAQKGEWTVMVASQPKAESAESTSQTAE
jgi:3-hydroxybutyryl-CoA dehydratase